MAYVSFRGVRVAPTNAKWAFISSVAAIVSFVIALVADRVVRDADVAFYAYTSAQLLMMATFIVAVPGVVVPLGLLLAPFAVAVFGLSHDHEVWATWWFWVFTLVCEIAGGFALVWFGTKYGKPEH